MPADVQVVDYDVSVFPFRDWFTGVLGTQDLENLHKAQGVTVENIVERFKELHKFCEARVVGLQRIVDEFMLSIVAPHFGKLLGWQAIPTIRFHFAVQAPELESETREIAELEPSEFLAKYYFDRYRVGMFHRDREYGLPSDSINLWIPVTNVWGANSLWIGGTKLLGRDALPVTARYSQALCFNGADRWHGAIWNTSGVTRVSFDVRFRKEGR